MRTTTALPAALLVLALVTGCAGTDGEADSTPTSGSNRPATEAPAEPEPTEEAPAEQDDVLTFGETYTYEDGVAVTIGAPQPYQPSETSAGAEGFAAALSFDVVVVNGSTGQFDPSMFTTTMQSANVEASEVFDSEKGVNGSPSTTLLPGREARWTIAYGVTDPADLVLEVSPSFDHANVIYTAQAGQGA